MAIGTDSKRLKKQNRILKIILAVITIVLVVFIYLYANKDKTKLSDLQTDNSVVITYSTVKHDDTSYIIQTHKTIFFEGKRIKETADADTVPDPGIRMEEAGGTYLKVPKEYEFFITIK